MEVRLERETALLETILFLEADPQDLASLTRISGLGKDVVEAALRGLEESLSAPDHGLELVRIGGGWTLAPKRELWEGLKEHYGRKKESKLSRAALETLSIIAYSQPVTRAEIEAVRGVDPGGLLRSLLEQGLVRLCGHREEPGRPLLYGTTQRFLEVFGLRDLSDLPTLRDLREIRDDDPDAGLDLDDLPDEGDLDDDEPSGSGI